MPLDYCKFVVDLFVEDNNLFAQFQFGNDVADMEKVKEECIHCDCGTLVLCHNVIPFAIRGRVKVCFSRKKRFYKR
ncbi:unnamed protein product [Cuscuta campestris]|uniref:Uncharacterized protein n=1 Tax=Cuscuta campestris TaxID=132261 RepID=A0A484NHY6_9ASTE|nr:unnamed protein product [Cuscuta campestris]